MPGPFTHIYTADRVRDLLAEGVTNEFIRDLDGELLPSQRLKSDLVEDLDPAGCAEAMNAWPKFTALGAIGPDLFFFLQDYRKPFVPCDEIMLALSVLYYLDDQGRLDDPFEGLLTILAVVSDTWAGILRLIIKIDKAWKEFVEWWDATVGPILDAAGQVVDDLTGGLYSELGDALSTFATALISIAAEELLTEWDIFSFFSLGMRSGIDEQAFLWSDMLHYRRTSEVPRRLLAHARDLKDSDDDLDRTHAEQLIAYALGWVCHVGTDTVAHGFVNEQAGGPFRTHWQRHHLVENHIDAWNYERTGTGDLPADDFIGSIDTYRSLDESALYFAVQIPQGIDDLPEDEQQGDFRSPLPPEDSREHRREREELLDTDGALPTWLAETIVQVLIEVYADPEEGGIEGLQEESRPHPLNLLGQPFQDGLETGTDLLGKWLDALDIDRSDIALDMLREAVAPEPPFIVPPGFPLPWEVQAAYRFMLSWFKRSFVSTLGLDKPKRPTIFTPPPSDFVPQAPDFSGVNPSDDPISEACEVLEALLDWAWKTLQQAAQAAYDIMKSAASAGTWPAREAIYETILLPSWQVVENVRMVLTHLGFVMPHSEERYPNGELARPSEIDLEIITLGHTADGAFAAALSAAFDVLGNLDADPALLAGTVRNPKSDVYPWLPVRKVKLRPDQQGALVNVGHDVVEFRRPWGYPNRNNETDPDRNGNYVETPRTTAGPYPRDARPDVLVGIDGPASNEMREKYEFSGCPEQTDLYNTRYVGHQPHTPGYEGGDGEDAGGTNPLGDPVVFSAYLIGQIADNPDYATSFNLDADRAFGYLCWDWSRDSETAAQDERGNTYDAPVTWPEGNDGHWAPPPPIAADAPDYPTPLQLRYLGRICERGDELGPEGGVG